MHVVTGATGNTGSVIVKTLLARGEKVRAVARNADRLKAEVQKGAEAFVADLGDANALTNAFTGAKVAYVLIPPDVANANVPAHQDHLSESIAEALHNSKIEHAVLLSSVGADKTDKTGPVLGLHHFEDRLKTISGLNALFIRAGYFMENTLAQAEIIRMAGSTAGPLRPELKVPMIATRDIGEFAAERMVKLDFKGKQACELLGERDLSMNEVTEIIGKAIGRPDLKYAQLPHEQLRVAIIQMGFSGSMTDLLLEMSAALNSGHMRALEPRSAANTTPTSYESFVKEVFVPIYRNAVAA